jgi:predicted MFS family arabinose efflux permease
LFEAAGPGAAASARVVLALRSSTLSAFAIAAILLGEGTATVYPTLLAAIGDVAHASWRASALGVYRLWRDLGYAAGALVAGVNADALGMGFAAFAVAGLTFVSGLVVAARMRGSQPRVLSR